VENRFSRRLEKLVASIQNAIEQGHQRGARRQQGPCRSLADLFQK